MTANRNHKDTHLSEADAFDWFGTFNQSKKLTFRERVALGAQRAHQVAGDEQPLMLRETLRADGRTVEMVDRRTGETREFLQFGSNNYLGLSTHPHVVAAAIDAIRQYGAGLPGPPVFNGHSRLHRQLEERLAALKGHEAAMLFPTGYAANLGVISGMVTADDVVVFDQLAHASLWDGLRLSPASHRRFRHNDAGDLAAVLDEETAARDRFVALDGIYSMDGDAAPLDEIVKVTRPRGAILLVDDAHATGIIGEKGHGSAEHFGVEGDVDISVVTLGKAFGVLGACAAASADLIDYLRFNARSYVFSTALPPSVVAATLAGLDVLEREPERRLHLRAIVKRAAERLRPYGLITEPAGAVVAVRAPETMDVKRAVAMFEEAGIFLNYVTYPAVPVHQQRFRVSVTASHTVEDIDRLCDVVEEIWHETAHGAAAEVSTSQPLGEAA